MTAHAVTFAILVQVVDEAGLPIDGASLQQVGVEVQNAAKGNRENGALGKVSQYNRRSYTSALGLATLGLTCSRQSAEEILTASPKSCEILCTATGYTEQKLLLGSVPLDHIDGGEGSAGIFVLKVVMREAK